MVPKSRMLQNAAWQVFEIVSPEGHRQHLPQDPEVREQRGHFAQASFRQASRLRQHELHDKPHNQN